MAMRVLVAGDLCPQARVAKLFEKGDYKTVLCGVKNIMAKVDYAILNFECPITFGGEVPIQKLGPNLHCSEKGIEAVKWTGFDCVTLANNHFKDFGEKGISNTIQVCTKYGLDHVGGGMNYNEASSILYKEIKGKKLAIINCCEHEFSIAVDNNAGSNPLNPINQFYAIKEARKNADWVLVIVHGGHEHFQLPSPRMVETYRFFVDAGADAVVNHHQHCFSGYELYNNKPIFYGLGNFCFDGNRSRKDIWNEGYMVKLSFEEIIKFEIIPYIQCKEKPEVRILQKDIYNERIEKLNNVITNPIKLKEAINSYYETCATGYSNIFEPCINRYYLGAKSRGWLPSLISKRRKTLAENFILCESHRDKLAFWLNNK